MFNGLRLTLVFALAMAAGACSPGDAGQASEAAAPQEAAQTEQAEQAEQNGVASEADQAQAQGEEMNDSGSALSVEAPADVAAPPSDAERTETGLASKVLRAGGGGDRPGPRDLVEVHYVGWTTDGRMFDASIVRDQTIEFPLDRVIAGWTEGLQLMTVGERRRFWIPEELAYQGRPGAPAGMLVFDVELVSFQAAPAPPETPADVAAPPADAERTESGLASKVLSAGTGDAHPSATSRVQVHYSGWTTDGEMFDSSVVRGQPAMFPLNAVIAGWTEGLQLMVVGERRRLWIPEELAYQGRPGAPAGMLVFDVELLNILD